MTNLDTMSSEMSVAARAASREIEWRSRYDGLVAVAYIGDRAVAGISGPWSAQFALTWWDRPLPARQLQLFDTLDEAKREVESWALRFHDGSALPASATPAAGPAKAGMMNHLLALLPDMARRSTRESPHGRRERMRRARAYRETDIGDLHFAAYE